ncbi:MAG: M13 family metallopeptidase [Prevotella sp.]|nr:M13 family metallopeptidase [Prevotella sp.]
MKTIKQLLTVMAIASITTGATAQTTLQSGIDLKNLDTTASAGNDFYQYACGGWMQAHPLPAAYSRYGSFDRLAEDNNKRINSILTELQNGTYAKGTVEQKLGDYYTLAMDSVRRNREGVKPVLPVMDEIEKAKTVYALKQLQLKYATFGYGIPMSIYFGADEKNASMNILNVSQGGITLGQKEYYLDNDSATAAIREAYKKHVVRMFCLYGFKEGAATKKMNLILDLETKLAQASKSRTELRDVEANYNKMTTADFESKYPHLRLTQLMNADGVESSLFPEVVVGQPNFFAAADALFQNISAEQLRAYMQWDLIMGSTGYLSDNVQAAHFDFFGKTMSGRKEDHPRWKRATNQVENQMGEALGRIYVERYFPAEAKARMETLVRNLQVALSQRIEAQEWMSDSTKKNAQDKLAAFYVKIGYPDKWKDLSELNIDKKLSYYENVQACRRFWSKYNNDHKAGKPVDNTEWFMTPQTVNAYYNPTTNEICFPAGILQVPFFDMNADDAFNYGAIGVVIGHEMTHGFDDQGRHYDKTGNMVDWWTENDANGFNERATQYAEFFNKIKVLPDLNANGKLTLGENLADHGGLQVAFHAFCNATANEPLPVIDGLTPEQRFFLAYAGVWAGNITEAEIRQRTKSDPHSLGRWRVNGALPHIDMWYEAFDVKPTDAMYLPKEQRLNLW